MTTVALGPLCREFTFPHQPTLSGNSVCSSSHMSPFGTSMGRSSVSLLSQMNFSVLYTMSGMHSLLKSDRVHSENVTHPFQVPRSDSPHNVEPPRRRDRFFMWFLVCFAHNHAVVSVV